MESSKKVISRCIYCPNPPDGEEHWLNKSLGTFEGNSYLTGRICQPCNVELGNTVDLELLRTSHIGVMRQVLGIKGRKRHEPKNVFEYQALQAETPVQVFRVAGEDLTRVFEDVVRRNSDGTLVATQGRVLVIATTEGQQSLRFPRGWGEQQLRAAAEARGLLGGRSVAAHVAAPESVEEFVQAARPVIRAVFGPFELDVYHSAPEGISSGIVPTLLRFNLTPTFFRGVAKISFHYFLWACPEVGGDEDEFSEIKAYIRRANGDTADFVQTQDSLVERIPAVDGEAKDCHVFASRCLGDDLVVQTHFFSQPVGPSFPTFVVRLGRRPKGLPLDWKIAHVAAYTARTNGHQGILYELPVH